ncbi:hypothetical protein [Planotetraspora sp. GP83]|uniref:hypothetical protein n=1 Tax=Planotetraspora sp. GP83 TaxID=3156264 RepID=UPI0035135D95
MLTQATAVLQEIAELDPGEARERLRGLREAYPDHRFRLVWQREAHDASLHYDLLITRPDRSTLSLSHCPDRGLPCARVVRLDFPDEATARTAANAHRHAEVGFYELAEREGVEAAFTEVRRADAPAEIFDARPGTVAGPFGVTLFKVIEVKAATLDEETRKAVQKTLFDEWIEERRSASKVEWFWGSASRTARPSP